MGFAKRHIMEMEERGNFPSLQLRGKYVCTCHFHDPYIKKMISDRGHQDYCSYCRKRGVVRDMYDLGGDIMWKITLYYTHPDNAGLYLASGFYDDTNEEIPVFKRVGPYIAPAENEIYESKEEIECQIFRGEYTEDNARCFDKLKRDIKRQCSR